MKIGDDVFGHLQYEPKTTQGAFSEYITAPVADCGRKPKSVSHKVAAAATTEAITALQAMRDLGGLDKGEKVLIVGAGGGVGSIAVSIAKRLGAHVTAVCDSKDVERVKFLGADVVLDRTKNPNAVWANKEKYNVIFDTPCGLSALRAFKYLKPKGTYVATLPSVSLFAAKFWGMFTRKRSDFVGCRSKTADLELIGEWLKNGMPVALDSTFPVKDVTEAMIRQRNPEKNGRVVVKVFGGW